MDDLQVRRVNGALEDGEHWRPFEADDIARIERKSGRRAPDVLTYVWSRFGSGTISGSNIYIYDPDEVADLLEQYADHGLKSLLPFATDQGSRDFAVDLAGRKGWPAGTVLLNARGVMTEQDLRPVASDVVALLDLARAGQLDELLDEVIRRFEESMLS